MSPRDRACVAEAGAGLRLHTGMVAENKRAGADGNGRAQGTGKGVGVILAMRQAIAAARMAM
ncbi:MAG: hypothetical protein Kow0026_03900 [Oricola sp.]